MRQMRRIYRKKCKYILTSIVLLFVLACQTQPDPSNKRVDRNDTLKDEELSELKQEWQAAVYLMEKYQKLP